ncbi:MAG: hypothetical protein A2Z72_01440 [Omnitrophica bacterium RBG_13_46_9]|nr:MAG: hypothetical protein A2Z72_01440 [Omnitrophica bacterium RBG_13_46_9]
MTGRKNSECAAGLRGAKVSLGAAKQYRPLGIKKGRAAPEGVNMRRVMDNGVILNREKLYFSGN